MGPETNLQYSITDEMHKNYKAAVPIDYNIVFSGSSYFVVIGYMNSIIFLSF